MNTNDFDITPAAVLVTWFGAHPLDAAAMQRVQAQWFQKDEAFDAMLRQRFGATVEAARTGRLDAWAENAEGRLALLIVLDQFSRNVFRGRPESFAADAQALARLPALGRRLIEVIDEIEQRVCHDALLEHAEDAAMQARSVALFAALRDAADAQPKAFFDGTLEYARKHQDVIARFGRFAHRNAVLGRASTPEELAYLAQPGAGF